MSTDYDRPGDEPYRRQFDAGDFRYTVAAYVKLLIRARHKAKPNFLAEEERRKWEVDNDDDQGWPAWRLMEQASKKLAEINERFIDRCGSGGIPVMDEDTPVTRLIDAVGFLVPAEGGAPYHNATLVKAAEQLKQGRDIDWDSLAEWDQLPIIRRDLDQLPHPTVTPRRPDPGNTCPVAVVFKADRKVRVNGREAILKPAQFDVIRVLLDRFPHGITKDVLDTLSGHSDSRGILRRLAGQDLWRDVIAFPGAPGAGGYRLVSSTGR